MLKKSTLLVIATCTCVLLGWSFVSFINGSKHPEPTEEEDEGERQAIIRAYTELTHRTAPGTDWHIIEAANARANEQYRLSTGANKTATAFAGGLLNGTWYERGNDNTAGRMSSFAYNPTGNVLYGMSDAGTLWQTNPPNGAWTLLNDDYVLASKVLAITPIAGGTRILMARDTNIVYSDNNGTSIQAATGISFPVAWGGNKVNNITVLNDATHSIYALVQGWNSSPFAAQVWLYRSIDSGQTFSKIHTFANVTNTDQVSLFSPFNSAQLYALSVSSGSNDPLYSITGSVVSTLSNTSSFPTAANKAVLTGLMSGTTLQLYAMVADNQIYQSVNNGTNWTAVASLPNTSWHVLSSSTKLTGHLFYGNNEAYRNVNGGPTFTKVNAWTDYYSNEATKLHADIQAISFFQDANGAEFCIIGTDGGAYYSNDYLGSVFNMSLAGLRVNQLWHHITDPNNPDVLFSGMQDQGLCVSDNASGTGLINQEQIISGDYGQMCISGIGDVLWAEYPGGDMYLYASPFSAPLYLTSYSLKGSQKSNAGWMMPTCKIPGLADDILLGGGNITGGGGSYLARLSYSNGNVTASQYPFNFRAASGNGTSGLSALAISGINRGLWYACTEDGTFFWSTNSGNTWTKTGSFSGTSGSYLYGAVIAPSKRTSGTVYYGGSGYSNPGMFVSRDSGLTFTPMNTGLPKTLINSLAVTAGDSLIFAATDAGPYVFITAQQQWYPLIDAATPACVWRTAEYLPSINTVRFSTYGRGVWDFVITGIGTSSAVVGIGASNAAQVYPNPVVSGGSINIEGLPQKPAQITIVDMAGRTVIQQSWNGVSSIRLPNLVTGNYVYAIRQEEQVFRGKLTIR